jgi:NAD(P)-dependent dehydrogenase (short-subunit alcohol dehydrogenase family)
MNSMIIIGASGGIGAYLADSFCWNNKMFLTYNKNPVQPSGRLRPVCSQLDVSCHSAVYQYACSIKDALTDRIVLINAAGISIDGMGHMLSSIAFEDVLRVNLTGVFSVCHAFLPIMRNNGWGRIINLSSVVGHIGVPGTVAYAASKAGLSGLTRTLAIENARKCITVNTLNLGYMSVGMIDTIGTELRDRIREKIPVGHLGSPDNVTAAIEFLVNADYVTGTEIAIDGGMLCS